MPWKIRVKHAAGQIAVELTPRTQEAPWVVGRVKECDIEIPVVLVSRQHCLIYVHGNAWVVEDAKSRMGTFINGSRIIRPTIIEAGDVITLSAEPDAPSLTVDYIPDIVQTATAEDVQTPPSAEPVESIDAFDGSVAMNDIATVHPRRHKKSNSATTGVILVGVTLLILGGGFIAFKKIRDKQQAEQAAANPPPAATTAPATAPRATPPATAPRLAPTPPPKPAPVAQAIPQTVVPKPAPVQPAPTEVTPPKPEPEAVAQNPQPTAQTPAPAPTALDPERQTDEWQRVDLAYRMLKPAEALFVFERYRIENPNSKLIPELNGYAEEAYDRLWWTRIRDLLSSQKTIQEQITKLDQDIRVENDANFKKQLRDQRSDASEKLLATQTALKEMSWTQPDPPDTDDDAKLAEYRKSRDPKFYQTWRKKALDTIKYSRGERAF